MRDDQDGSAQLVDLLEQRHQLERTRRVKVAGRLVRDDEARVVDEGARDGNALLLAARKIHRLFLRFVREADQIEHIGHALLDRLTLRADGAHRERDVLVNRLGLDETEILIDYAERAAQIRDTALFHLADVVVVDQNLSLGRPHLGRQELDDGRFARAGRADQKDKLSLVHTQAGFIHRADTVVVYDGDIVHPDQKRSSSMTS